MKKNIENSDMPISRPTTLAPRSVRRRKIENGMSGCAGRDSIARNEPEQHERAATRRASASTSQPAELASTRA